MSNPKLLVLSTEFPPGPGGIGTHAFQLACGLAGYGWEINIKTPQDCATEEEITVFNQEQKFKVFRQHHRHVSFYEGIVRLLNLVQGVNRFRPNLILATGARSVWLTSVLCRFYRIPWVAVAHGGIEFGTRKTWERAISRWAYSQPDVVICVSEYTRQQMLGMGVRPPHTVVIHNGADEMAFFPVDDGSEQAFRQSLNLKHAKILLTVGSVTERKGQEVVIRALPYILREVPDTHYVMVGLPQLQSQLSRIAQELGVITNVHFLGQVDQLTLLSAYNACDLFVMTSRHSSDGDSEGYGIAVIEAALCRKAAIVSNESGLAEAVINGQTGLHVSEDNPEQTAQVILKLLGEKEYRELMEKQAYNRALNEQTWSSRVKLYQNIFLRIIRQEL